MAWSGIARREHNRLMKIPGIGPLPASAIVAVALLVERALRQLGQPVAHAKPTTSWGT